MQQLKSGIYQIRNLVNGKRYIGSAKNFQKRKHQHYHYLKYKKHHSKYLQNAFLKYGKENFIFEILVKCPSEYLLKLEQWFLDNLKPEYNISKIAVTTTRPSLNENQKIKLSNKLKGQKRSEETKNKLKIIQQSKSPKVYQYDLNGNFIKEWDSVYIASKFYGVKTSGIYHVCKGDLKVCANFMWSLIFYSKLPKYKRNKYKEFFRKEHYTKPILQYDLEGNVIKRWSRIKEYCSQYGYRPNVMWAAIKNQNGFYKGFIWKLID